MPDEIILILANGEWPDTTRLPVLADRAGTILATDGAWAKAVDAGIEVGCVVGDLDSLTTAQRASLLESGVEVEVHPPDKDFTDLELAVDRALAMRAGALIVFGAFGGRIDHTLANVLMLEKALDRGVDVELVHGTETAWLVRGTFALPDGRAGDRISLIPLSRGTVVRTEGLRYRLSDEPLVRASAHGVSNIIDATPVRVTVRSGTLLVVHGPPREEGTP